jgi:hypothetical protein
MWYGRGMKFAYADPPYYGLAKAFYGDMHPEAHVYDTLDGHQRLIDRLCQEFPDGWAMSLHTPSLRHILPLCPEDCRVAAWVKPFASFKPNVNPGYAWEPVIFRGGRKFTRSDRTVRDFVAANITLKRGFAGAKPAAFCFWVFNLLNMQPEDEFHDLFPGSGAVKRAHEAWQRQYHGLFATA